MSQFIDELGLNTLRDWMALALGKKLGGGIGRTVFVYDLNPRYVIKIESSGYQNAIEREIWGAVKTTQYARWFAPVKSISGLGTIILMERTLPAPRRAFPDRMPDFLGDLKYSNFGLLRGKLVCHDYGTVSNFLHGFTRTKIRFRKSDWWDSEDGSTFDDTAKT